MKRRVVVVESPNKLPKVSKCLGPGFVVVATVGHFRDLPEDELGIELPAFRPRYVTQDGKAAVVAKLKDVTRDAEAVLLATDADREGEAIAWHVAEVLGLQYPQRLRFTELTPRALQRALAEVSPLNRRLVDAQQARRILDRLVGYQVSPLLSVFGPNHSAGRVQSAALHLVVQRELAREAFVPESFWTVAARYAAGFSARVARVDERGVWTASRFLREAEAVAAQREASAAPHRVEALDTKPKERHPLPPFTTSTLQQAASAQLELRPADTMALAQALFEKGAITYHRTDSVTVSEEAVALARAFLAQDYPEALPQAPVVHRNVDTAQEAHEAIRPTALTLEADVQLTAQEESLFHLITRRFLASQCRPARLEVTTVRLAAGGVRLVARGIVVRFPSFLKYLAEDETTAAAKHEAGGCEGKDDEAALPPLQVGAPQPATEVRVVGDATKPPPRFTQATLVRELQRTGLGRPSTYASTLATLFERRYLAEEKKAVLPTPRGRLVDAAVAASFPEVVATDTTAQLEARLDAIAQGRATSLEVLEAWHAGFRQRLAAAPGALEAFARSHVALVEAVSEAPKPTGKPCPICGKQLFLRHGRKGAFLACSGWPDCGYRADPSARATEVRCPTCAAPMVEQDGRFGRYARCTRPGCAGRVDRTVVTAESCPRCEAPLKDRGAFLGCSQYPDCGFTVDAKAWARARKAKAACPKCGRLLVQRKGPRGVFLACVGYPDCRHTAEVPRARRPKVAHVP